MSIPGPSELYRIQCVIHVILLMTVVMYLFKKISLNQDVK